MKEPFVLTEDIRAKMKHYAENKCVERGSRQKPIFEVYLIENADQEKYIEKDGEWIPTGEPDEGDKAYIGYYHELTFALTAVHTNSFNMHKSMYEACFVICRFPGLFEYVGPEGRIYCKWDEDFGGYREMDEPEIFHQTLY